MRQKTFVQDVMTLIEEYFPKIIEDKKYYNELTQKIISLALTLFKDEEIIAFKKDFLKLGGS